MSIFQKNMDAFYEYRRAIYDLLKEYQEKKDEVDDTDDDSIDKVDKIETLQAKDGNNVLSVTKDGRTVRLNSMYRPAAEAEKWCKQYPFQNLQMNIMMFGIGNGIFVKKMLEEVNDDAMIFLYEPCVDIFLHVMEEEDFTELIQNRQVSLYFVGLNEINFYFGLASRTHWSNLLTQQLCIHPGYRELFPKEYKQFDEWIVACNTTEIVNRNTGIFFAKSFTRNALNNLSFVPQGRQIWEYVGVFPEEMPVIIVSAGPSLDKNIQELRKAKGRALIFAVDTAVRRLLQENIHFDCMITVDPEKPEDYMQLPGCQEVPLFCGLQSNYKIMDYHKGQKIWIRDSGTYLARLYRDYQKDFLITSSGGSVATSAFIVCVALKFKKIILVGQDLAYDGDATHAGGEISKIRDEEKTICMVEGINGGMVKSRGDWKEYLGWFERNVESFQKEEGHEVIDATEGGALIHGTTIMTLREAIETFCSEELTDIQKIFAERKPSFSGEEEEVKKALLHIEKEFRGISTKTQKGVENIDKAMEILEKDIESTEIDKYAKEVRKVNSFLEKQRAYEILEQYIEEGAVGAVQEIDVMTGDEWEDRKATLSSARELYKVIVDGVKELQPLVDEALERLRK